MKIGLDCFVFRFPLTGIGNYTFQIAKGLVEKKKEDEIFFYVKDNFFATDRLKKIAEEAFLHEVYTSKSKNFIQNKYIAYLKMRILDKFANAETIFNLELPLLEKKLNHITEDLDVYHAVDWFFQPNKKVKRKIITFFDLTTTRMPEYHDKLCIGKEIIKKEFLDSFDIILSISDSTKNDLINFYGIKEEKIKTIYLGADQVFEEGILKSKEEIFIKYKVPVERPYFLSVSTIEPRKNFIQVLQSFKAYKLKNKDKDSILICTGMWGWKTSSLKKYLDSFDFRDDVFFTGYVDINDMPTLYHFAKSFIYLSLFEGFGLPILEAMKSKVPVICSNVSSMPEVIGEEGWLVDPLKTEEIVHAMEQISQNETLVKEKVNKAFERSKNFTWEKTVKETLEAYEI